MRLGTVSVRSVEGLCREEEDIREQTNTGGEALGAGLAELPLLSLGHISFSPLPPHLALPVSLSSQSMRKGRGNNWAHS